MEIRNIINQVRDGTLYYCLMWESNRKILSLSLSLYIYIYIYIYIRHQTVFCTCSPWLAWDMILMRNTAYYTTYNVVIHIKHIIREEREWKEAKGGWKKKEKENTKYKIRGVCGALKRDWKVLGIMKVCCSPIPSIKCVPNTPKNFGFISCTTNVRVKRCRDTYK